jgi:hypothetical protein
LARSVDRHRWKSIPHATAIAVPKLALSANAFVGEPPLVVSLLSQPDLGLRNRLDTGLLAARISPGLAMVAVNKAHNAPQSANDDHKKSNNDK